MSHGRGHDPRGPYRAEPAGASFGPLGSGARWVFTVLVGLMSVLFLVALGTWTAAIIASESHPRHEPDGGLMATGMISFFVLVFMLYGQIAAGLYWLYKAWSWLPWDQRYTRHWRSWLTPSQVALMMLIPYFHYYWMFVANLGLCEALDRLRVSYPTRDAAPKNLAIACCVAQLLVPFPVAAILWLIFMAKIERMTREMSASMAPRRAGAF